MRITIKSDVTGKSYTGENVEELLAQCKTDDEKFEKAQAEEKAEKEKKSNEISKMKKELSKSVEAATDKLNDAREAYNEAKTQAAEKVQTVNDEVNKLLEDARNSYDAARKIAREKLDASDKEISEFLAPYEKSIREAETEKFNAIVKFTEKFGPYQITYTGDKATEEYKKMQKEFDDMFDSTYRRIAKALNNWHIFW